MRARFDFLNDGPPVLFTEPRDLLVARSVDDVPGVMAAADRALNSGCHVAGWVAYEAGPAFDAALTTQPPGAVPLVCFGVYEDKHEAEPLTASDDTVPSATWSPALTREQHAQGVAAIREAIADGETYQINYTFRLHATLGSLDGVYATLASAERVPYAACLETEAWAILSLSPELFFARHGQRIVTQPMKGTAPRGRWREEDEARAELLRTSTKNRAENVMIVDLCRNDLTRVCRGGTVAASSLYEVLRYPTVWQMVSTVEGTLQENAGLADIFGALFPAGSITGAPKSSSMRLLAALEHAPRGVYCGAIGYASPGGQAVFNVAIRTMTVNRHTGAAEYGVGGGITWDSTAPDEYAEAMQKAACLEVRPPFSLIETLRWERGQHVRLDQHLARLKASAGYFGIPFDEPTIREAISASSHHLVSPSRVRVTLSGSGVPAVARQALETTPVWPMVALASTPVDSSSRWLFHKTTRREVYDCHRASHPDVFDVLLWNERGEVTEFTRGNVVLELNGRKVTPLRSCGLLAGVFRQTLLDAGDLTEAIVQVEDLRRATRVWFVNSLREWVEVRGFGRPGP